jgi:tetratricopeptide (TPR) repeat protein
MKTISTTIALLLLVLTFQISKAENLTATLKNTIENQGIQEGIKQYKLLKNEAGFNLSERTLDDLGYQLLNEGETQGAIKIFKLNQEEFPNSETTNASLASAYTICGDKNKAHKYFDKALKMNALNVQAETLGNQKDGVTTFRLMGYEEAKKVALVGNFNQYQDDKNVLYKTENGVWECKVRLPKGVFYYQFLIEDNAKINDPANKISYKPAGDWNSVVVVN